MLKNMLIDKLYTEDKLWYRSENRKFGFCKRGYCSEPGTVYADVQSCKIKENSKKKKIFSINKRQGLVRVIISQKNLHEIFPINELEYIICIKASNKVGCNINYYQISKQDAELIIMYLKYCMQYGNHELMEELDAKFDRNYILFVNNFLQKLTEYNEHLENPSIEFSCEKMRDLSNASDCFRNYLWHHIRDEEAKMKGLIE